MRILITGVTGFAGGHLAEVLLESQNNELIGLSRGTQWPAELQHLNPLVQLIGCDLTEAAAVEAILRQTRPEQIYHLAGYAQTGRAFWDAEVVWTSNLTATRRLYEAVSRWGGRPRILYVGSGMVYGAVDSPDEAHDERSILRPMSPYAASKAAADLLSYQMTRDPGLDIIRVRPFNHIGPRQSPDYAVAHFARQIAEAEASLRPPILETGDLGARRDLTDVRDMVRAYTLLMKLGRTGDVYNAGTGKAPTMAAVLERLLAQARVSVEVRQRADPRRGAAPAVLRADPTKLCRETGWAPTYGLEQTLRDILHYWRQHVGVPLASVS